VDLTANNDNPATGDKRGPRCPNCGKPTDADFRPFCSGRCKDVDLSRWLRGAYAIPGGKTDEDDDGRSAIDDQSLNARPDQMGRDDHE
jgi:endogenous inhibitor of DNA gyrase (YacG/DUF329 family)